VQLTVRLESEVIQLIDEIALKMQKGSVAGVKITRTDALRAAIIRGSESLSGKSLKSSKK
jgi:hypothetical protein